MQQVERGGGRLDAPHQWRGEDAGYWRQAKFRARVRDRPAEGCSLLSTAGEQTLGHLAATAGGRVEWFVAGRSGAALGELELRGAAGGDSRVAVAAP